MEQARFAWLVFVVLSGCAGARAEALPVREPTLGAAGAIQVDVDAVVWKPGPPNMPKGVELSVLEGDPKQAGIFTLRLKAPPGFMLAPHTHPVDERVTVISGSISVGFGARIEKQSARTFRAGAFYVNPPGATHYVFSDQGAVVQITGMGPWKVDFQSEDASRP